MWRFLEIEAGSRIKSAQKIFPSEYFMLLFFILEHILFLNHFVEKNHLELFSILLKRPFEITTSSIALDI